MKIYLTQNYYIESDRFTDLSLPIINGDESARAFGLNKAVIKPFQVDGFIGSVELGGSVNCFDVSFNPHGNGTHTEGVGHISQAHHSVHNAITDYIFPVIIISVTASTIGDDQVLLKDDIVQLYQQQMNSSLYKDLGLPKAIAIRTLPNKEEKRAKKYSGTNPTYIEPEALAWMCEQSIMHLLTDLPSVDKEYDDGVLAGHHAFWNYPESPRLNATITEMIYIPSTILDGVYMMNLQVSAFVSDAAPSRPIIFEIKK